MTDFIKAALREAADSLESLMANEATLSNIEEAAEALLAAFASGNRVFSCGNGGSMSDAMHFAEELSGRYRQNRKALPATAISDVGHISCVANDFGYEYIFSRYLESQAKPGDILFGISTSGTSKNVVEAARRARELGVRVIALTGRTGTILGELAHTEICTPAGRYADRVQELHIKVIHILIELIERRLFPENYAEN